MVLPKICGLETEYGILAKGSDMSPTMASSMLVNAYIDPSGALGKWDFLHEQPEIDARGVWDPSSQYPHVEALMANAILTNGSRYYVDHAHPELSTPECISPRSALIYDVAGEEIVRRSLRLANERFSSQVEFVAYKNNSDGKGNSYGCHENYLVDRNVPFGALARSVMPHFVTRQVFLGAGKVGVENRRDGERAPEYQLSQRADFFEEEVGLETTVRRPIVNTRDEPHGDPTRFRRLHVIAGDANMSQWATFMKLGTTCLLLAVIEDGQFPAWLQIANPVDDIRRVSHSVDLTTSLTPAGLVTLTDGRTIRALDIQQALATSASQWLNRSTADPTGGDGEFIVAEWLRVLEQLDQCPEETSDRIDWVAKAQLLKGMAQRHGNEWNTSRMRALDLQYHDMRPEKGLAARLGLRTLVTTEDCMRAESHPPVDTRAYFRGRCIEKFGTQIVSGNWDSLVFDVGQEYLVRIPMMDPLKGTAALVGQLIDGCSTAQELVSALGESAVERVQDDPGW
jgi:proteasome accessory factor A